MTIGYLEFLYLSCRCADLNDSDIDIEPCKDPCKNNPCPVGQKCVPDPTVCLTLMQKPCTQYQCGKHLTRFLT